MSRQEIFILDTPQQEDFDTQNSCSIEHLEQELDKFSHLLERSPIREPNFQEVRKKERVLQECQNNELEKLREQNLKLKAENEAYSAKIENIMAILPKTLENHLLVHKLEKENLQLRKIVDQAEKENMNLQNELVRAQETQEEAFLEKDRLRNQVVARFEAMMLDFASKSFTNIREELIKELEGQLESKNEEFERLKQSFEADVQEQQAKVRELMAEIERLQTKSEKGSLDVNSGRLGTRFRKALRKNSEGVSFQITLDEDTDKPRTRRRRRLNNKLIDSEEEDSVHESNVENDDDEEVFEPEETSEEDEDDDSSQSNRKKKRPVKRKINERKRVKKNETKEAISNAKNTIAYHLSNSAETELNYVV